mmetsp:Transcript_12163/g.12242  ORF Transcript_12163/g.12242 Transcript_12163/m.12242 type:complete len:170 (+) Transcript_12163:72-581(+)
MSLKEKILRAAELQFRHRREQGYVAPISPTPDDLIDIISKDIIVSSSDCVADLGCGDGRWLHSFASKYNCWCFGVDKDPERLSLSRERAVRNRLNIELLRMDLFDFNLASMSVIIFYLFREACTKMMDKIEKECVDGTIIIVIGFQIPNRKPLKLYRSSTDIPAYMYKI